jgi:hypothetical protein
MRKTSRSSGSGCGAFLLYSSLLCVAINHGVKGEISLVIGLGGLGAGLALCLWAERLTQRDDYWKIIGAIIWILILPLMAGLLFGLMLWNGAAH